MRKITILSIVVSSLLFIACSSEQKHEDGEKSTKEIYEDYKKNKDEIHSKVQYPKSGETTTSKTANKSEAKTATVNSDSSQKLTHGDEKTTVTDIIKKTAGGSALAAAVTPAAAKESKKESSSSDDVFDYKLKPKAIGKDVYCFFGALDKPTKENAGFMVNSCYVKTKEGYWVMGTGPSYEFARQSYEAMKKIADLPVKYIVNSHVHDDHWLGNGFFKKKFNATLIGPEGINKNFKEGDKTRMYKMLPANAIKGTHIIKLDETPDKDITKYTLGGEDFLVYTMPMKAHTAKDLFVYIPSRKVVLAGDLIMNGRINSDRDGSVMGELMAIDMMKKLDWDILVPGHGFITDKTAMDETIQYFTLMKERVQAAMEDGSDATDITDKVKLEEFKDKAMYDILNARNVGYAYDEFEMLDDE
jgi:glyoxylase-like metal-dependent hydrolase (beta-lactamase superfamily II)